MKKLKKSEFHNSVRGYFAGCLYNEMVSNPDIVVLTADLGYGFLDRIKTDFPDRFINCGASEQAMLGIAIGLALKGKIPFTYTITSFYLRCAEGINIYLHGEQIPVKMAGSGLFDDYEIDGYTHDGTQAQKYLNSLVIRTYYPKTKEEVGKAVKEMIANKKPSFIGLKR
jgi:transketolase